MIASGVTFAGLCCLGSATIHFYGLGIFLLQISLLWIILLIVNYKLAKLSDTSTPSKVKAFLVLSLIFSLVCIVISLRMSSILLPNIIDDIRLGINQYANNEFDHFLLSCFITVCGLYLVHTICLIRGLLSLNDYKKWYAKNGRKTTSPPKKRKKKSPADDYYDDGL